jgi:hypothetical protein
MEFENQTFFQCSDGFTTKTVKTNSLLFGSPLYSEIYSIQRLDIEICSVIQLHLMVPVKEGSYISCQLSFEVHHKDMTTWGQCYQYLQT